jgi:hypothetical protein
VTSNALPVAFEAVACYRTADGVVHTTEKAAQEHAENIAGDKLQLLLKDVPGMGHQISYYVTVDMIKRAAEYTEALRGLLAFPPPAKDDE